MAYYAIQHQVLFHDTMAYGTHHHSANIKFQNIAREALLFESDYGDQPSWQEQLKDIIMLTREAYSLNLGPAALGEKVAILMTYEDPTRSTMRLCFRIIGATGQPISCGYQTMILIDKDTYEPVPAPVMLTQYLDSAREGNLIEELVDPSFSERAHAGGREIRRIFTNEICDLGRYIANAPVKKAYPRITDVSLNEYEFGSPRETSELAKT